MPNTSLTLHKDLKNYAQLREAVKETLLLGRRRIEEAKVQTYLKTGQLIDEHIFKKGSREEHYGKKVIEKLSTDLKISSSVLWRCLRFARYFKKILARGPQSFPKRLAWSHYRKLITVPDEGSRLSFMQRAEKGGWTAEKLGGKIRLETGSQEAEKTQESLEDAKIIFRPLPKLIPKKGMLYTYRLIAPDSVHDGDDRLWIDLGFQAHRRIPLGAKGFIELCTTNGKEFEKTKRNTGFHNSIRKENVSKEGDIAESFRGERGEYSITASERTKNDLFTYKAFVERVVDADTLIVKIDLGFENRIRQYLRLRGINAPELSTEAGRKAKAFVERELAKAPHIILTSSRSDKYDRYLADVFYEKDPGQEFYLNQILLDQGLAERM